MEGNLVGEGKNSNFSWRQQSGFLVERNLHGNEPSEWYGGICGHKKKTTGRACGADLYNCSKYETAISSETRGSVEKEGKKGACQFSSLPDLIFGTVYGTTVD